MVQAHQSQAALNAGLATGVYPPQGACGGYSSGQSRVTEPCAPKAQIGLMQALSGAAQFTNEVHELVSELEQRLTPLLLDAPPVPAGDGPRRGESGVVCDVIAHQQRLSDLATRLKLLIGRINL